MPTLGRLMLWALLTASLSSCGVSLFANNKSPVIEDHVGNHVGTLAITTDRRIVLVRLRESAENAGRFCSEPPPDAGQNLSSAVSSLLDVSSERLDAELKAQLAKSLATNFQSFLKRSQGLQLYRDAMYHLCQAFLNGAITGAEINTLGQEYFAKSAALIDKELILTGGKIDPVPFSSAPIAPPVVLPPAPPSERNHH